MAETDESGSSKTCTSLPIRLMEVNPCTLQDTSKRKSYLDQSRSAGVHIMFAQEIRRRQSGIFAEHGFILACYAADSGGHGGCMIAVSATFPVSSPVANSLLPATVSRDDLNLIHAGHRIIVVRIATPRFSALCVSIHGFHIET